MNVPIIDCRFLFLPALQPFIQTDRKRHGKETGVRPRIVERAGKGIERVVGGGKAIYLCKPPYRFHRTGKDEEPGD